MAKIKTKFVCGNCGYASAKWLGKCPECDAWNSFSEEVETPALTRGFDIKGTNNRPVLLKDVEVTDELRYSSGIGELDIVLGGGIINGSLVLVGGDPGIGKSTLLLQVANYVGMNHKKVLYVSGEESIRQTKLRSDRLGVTDATVFIIAENNMDAVVRYVDELQPDLLIVDSIQTMYCSEVSSAPGSVSQVREGTMKLMNCAKSKGVATFIVGHVTKSGAIAGPKVLEHMVDTVLYFEGEKHNIFRMVRAVKNRYGSTNEIGVFEMTNLGLMEVKNPSAIFLSEKTVDACGSVITAVIEGSRPVLVELQALVSESNYASARRTAVGLDYNKTVMLLAVIDKIAGLTLHTLDCYLNVVGGMSITEPSPDLAVMAAIASSYREKQVSNRTVIFGEVGLTGEVRSVTHCQQRIAEAKRLGFEMCIVPRKNMEGLSPVTGMQVYGVETVQEAFEYIFK
ncbi:MAG: DNA repair protein RadA [Clostridia bacterium]|nr:DNA repair protein RadA [Clostridia bacterium]